MKEKYSAPTGRAETEGVLPLKLVNIARREMPRGIPRPSRRWGSKGVRRVDASIGAMSCAKAAVKA